MLEGLAYMMDNPVEVPIVATDNKISGQLTVNVVPCEEDGNEELNEENLSDDPMDLLNNALDFKVKIDKITGLPPDFCRNIYCEYEFYMDKTKNRSKVSTGRNQNPVINFERQHHFDCVTKFLIDYLLEDKMTIKIYGNQDLNRQKRLAPASSAPQKSKSSSQQQSLNSTVNTSATSSNKSVP